MSENEEGLQLFKRADKLRGERQPIWDVAWQQLSQYFYPDLSDINTEKTEGVTGWFDRVYDSTPIRAASTCSIGVRNWVTPSTDPWLSLAPPNNLRRQTLGAQSSIPRVKRLLNPAAEGQDDEEAIQEDDTTRWLGETSDELLQALSSSNFYSVIQPFNRGACVFGTALLFLEEGETELFNFEQFKVGTFVIAENKEKRVDTVIRWFKLTVRQAVQKFCERDERTGKYNLDKLPKKIAEAYEKKNYDIKFTFLHHVFPRDDYKEGAIGARGKMFRSVYQSELEKKILQDGGYDEMPYFCLRWSRWGTDDQAYGCSPAFETLMEARQINYVTQFQDALSELLAYPRLLYPDNLDGNVQLAPGGVTTYDADEPNAIPREWLTGGNNMEVDKMLERKSNAINQAFFVDIFRMFDELEGKQQRTAFEIAQRLGEKLDKFTGTFDQYVTDLINPMVRRMIGIAMRAGQLSDPPQELMIRPGDDPKAPPALAVPKIIINSRVTLAIKALRNAGTQNTINTLGPLVEMRPDILDNIDLDRLTRATGRNYGMSEKDFRPMKKVLELRAIRMEQQQQERAAMLAEQTSKAAKNLGGAPQDLQEQTMAQINQAQQ